MIVIYYDSVDQRIMAFNQLNHLDDCIEEDDYENQSCEAAPSHGSNFTLSFHIECRNIFGKVITVAQDVH